MSEALDKLTAEVTAAETVRDGVKAFVTGLAEQIKSLAADQAAMLALANRLHSASADIATAITTNTTAVA